MARARPSPCRRRALLPSSSVNAFASPRRRVDVAITSDSLAKVMRPVITMEASLSDSRVITFEVPVDKFHELRYSVAKVLQTITAAEAAPALKIA